MSPFSPTVWRIVAFGAGIGAGLLLSLTLGDALGGGGATLIGVGVGIVVLALGLLGASIVERLDDLQESVFRRTRDSKRDRDV